MGDGGLDGGPGPACDLSKPFGPPTFVPGLANTGATIVGSLRLSPDSLTGYFHASFPDRGNLDLYTATRTAPSAPFEAIAPLADNTVNTIDDEANPAVSSDGLTLIFQRFAGQAWHLHKGTRGSTAVPFAYAGPVSVNGSAAQGASPFLREDSKVLYFISSNLPVGDNGNWDIYRAAWDGSSLGPAVPVSELNTVFQEYSVAITSDDRTIYLQSSRPPASGQSDRIWMATRASTSDPFLTPVNVAELNSFDVAGPSYVARGGCALYFSTLGTSTIMSNTGAQYVAEKPPR